MGYSEVDDLLTVQEVAARLKLSVLTIYKDIKEGDLPAVEFGGHYRVEKNALQGFVKNHRVTH